jgi:hypothetical protein
MFERRGRKLLAYVTHTDAMEGSNLLKRNIDASPSLANYVWFTHSRSGRPVPPDRHVKHDGTSASGSSYPYIQSHGESLRSEGNTEVHRLGKSRGTSRIWAPADKNSLWQSLETGADLNYL